MLKWRSKSTRVMAAITRAIVGKSMLRDYTTMKGYSKIGSNTHNFGSPHQS